MMARDLIVETASALNANRARSLLTVLGIVIGIGAVIAMTALIGGIKQSLVSELGLNQARMVYLYCYPERDVTLDDLHALEERMPEYECLTASSYASATATAETKSMDADIEGVLPSYFAVMGLKAQQGAFFTEADDTSGELVAVLDQNVVRKLYGKPDAQVVGKSIQLNGVSYAIVGVVDTEGAMSDNGTIYLPFSTCSARLSGYWGVNNMSGLAVEDADMDAIADQTKAALMEYFQLSEEQAEDDIYIQTMKSMIDELDATMTSFELMMTAVASISLLVGGIGIMNMMLTNVTERIREIGLRKALGARRSDITKQFLLESVCLCLAGGLIGIVAGYAGSYAVAALAGDMLSSLGAEGQITPVIDPRSVGMVTGICIAIGILFGYYPARRAAKLDPVESLHYQ